jgi:hypothetical protein
MFRRAIRRRSDGTFDVRLTADERQLLRQVMDELRAVITEEVDDPSLRRLFPPTYGEAVMREAAYQAMAGDELRKARLFAIETIAATAERDRLTEEEAVRWAQALNALRLVIGTRLDVTEDASPPAPNDADAPAWALYHYLSVLLEEIVDAIGS